MFADIMIRTFYGNTIGQWLIALAIIAGVFIVGKILYWTIGKVVKALASKTKNKLDDILVDMIEEPIIFALTLGGIWYALRTLVLSEVARSWVDHAYFFLIIINIAWFISRLFEALYTEYLVPIAGKSETDLDDQLLPIVRKIIKFVIWTIAIVVALNNAGYDVGALIAGLGIGGLAFALAAKDTLSNVFGGFTIFADKPFKIGDRIKIEGFDGTVKEIGLRSTRLQTLEGRIVTIPNSVFADNPVENITWEPTRKVVMTLGLVYDTTPAQMEKAMKLLRDISKKNKQVNDDVLVSFNAFGDFSMNIFFAYYIKKGEDILGTQSEMNLEILKQFNKNKLEFAYPTQVLYNKKG